MRKNKSIRTKLWKKNPHCHWCGIKTVQSVNGDGRQEPNTATLDHLYSKFDPERRYGEPQQKVLACSVCNLRRGRQAEALYLQRKEK